MYKKKSERELWNQGNKCLYIVDLLLHRLKSFQRGCFTTLRA